MKITYVQQKPVEVDIPAKNILGAAIKIIESDARLSNKWIEGVQVYQEVWYGSHSSNECLGRATPRQLQANKAIKYLEKLSEEMK